MIICFLFSGQLCLDTEGEALLVPTLLASANDPVSSDSVVKFEAGVESSYILFDDGTVDSCGSNTFGQLGDGTNDDSFGTQVSLDDIVDVYTGPSAYGVFFVSADGTVYATGLNDRGQLGVGDNIDSNLPIIVDFPPDVDVSDISASNYHSVSR